MKKLIPLFLALTGILHAESYDIVVFGATSGGVTAAVQAARQGKTVILLEPGKHVGGMTASGLGWIDIKGTASTGGVAREFIERVIKRYADHGVDTKKFGNSGWVVEPHVAEKVYNEMLGEAKVPVEYGYKLASAAKSGARITSITSEAGKAVEGKMFIDATYEGDLMAKAKVSYIIGRESKDQYKEDLAGNLPEPANGLDRKLRIDPYVTPGDPKSGLIPLVQPDKVGNPGDASDAIQDYNYRLCMTKDPANRLPIDPPADYDPKQYELVGRFFTASAGLGTTFALEREKGFKSYVLKMDRIPRGKTDTNNGGRISTDYAGYSQNYPEASYAEREKIAKAHENYIRGYLHFLATDPRVPEKVRNDMKQWGLAKDEFTDNGGWPFQLYVRQARRLVGEYVMTQHDALRKTKFEDSVGMASYSLDSHICRRIVDDGIVIQEGGFYQTIPGPYSISYRALVPKVAECENLFVPACCSASHVAYASVRMEPVFMVLGQSSATAAVQAIEEKAAIQKIDIKKLQERLIADKQVLDLPAKK
ncbi:MAG TPA: FAD-dependent oxidoreductase [Luteolibacter sp.]|nr:FAD-dependent oxidoreductase [Luteolibacter sp.]